MVQLRAIRCVANTLGLLRIHGLLLVVDCRCFDWLWNLSFRLKSLDANRNACGTLVSAEKRVVALLNRARSNEQQ